MFLSIAFKQISCLADVQYLILRNCRKERNKKIMERKKGRGNNCKHKVFRKVWTVFGVYTK
jgi:hypothetical protein